MKFLIAALTASVVSAVGIHAHDRATTDSLDAVLGLDSIRSLAGLDAETRTFLTLALDDPEQSKMAEEVIAALETDSLTQAQRDWL